LWNESLAEYVIVADRLMGEEIFEYAARIVQCNPVRRCELSDEMGTIEKPIQAVREM
jgi:hypothetical protein